MKKGILFNVLIAAAGISSLFPGLSAETQGLQFLSLPVFAAAEGMGGAGSGLFGNASGLFYNPACLVSREDKRMELSVGYLGWIEGSNKESVVFVTSPKVPVLRAVSVDYLTISGLNKFDASGNITGDLGYQDAALGLNAGVKLGGISVGANIKYLKEDIDTYKGSGYGLDAGILYPLIKEKLVLGAALLNAGTFSLEEEDVILPQTLRVGLGFKLEKISFGMDWEKDDSEALIHLGSELRFQQKYAVRIGWQNTGMEDSSAISFGFGLEESLERAGWKSLAKGAREEGKSFLFNYSYSGAGDFGSVHRFDVGIRF
ncbi:MAG TPA: hypothetical protein VJC03_03545 [bacterium]|nr:hypothetical protein [bacterium]